MGGIRKVKKFAYQIITRERYMFDDMTTASLNSFGEEGWELVAVNNKYGDNGKIIGTDYIFKKEIEYE